MAEWRKAIPERRDTLQSDLLVWVMVPLLAISCLGWFSFLRHERFVYLALGISLTFAIAVWALRSATPAAALCGAMTCFLVLIATGRIDESVLHSGIAPLLLLFVLTFLSTRAGRSRKEQAHLAEGRKGRSANQVIANLGVAGLASSLLADALLDRLHTHAGISDEGGVTFVVQAVAVMVLAALAEATADTVSSEIGQAFGGAPILLTTLRRVPPGTDGAVTLTGTAAGFLAASLVVIAGAWSMHLTLHRSLLALTGGLIGWLADSILGATVERRGWLGNDLVNFLSTAIAALITLLAR